MSILAAYAVPHPPLIIPAVGQGRERDIQATIDAYDEVARRIAALEPELVIVTSPHATLYRDWFCISPGNGASGNMHQFRAYDTTLTATYDEQFTARLSELCAELDFPAGTDGERDASIDHATYIPLWFLNRHYTNYRCARIGLSGFDALTHYRFGQLIARVVDELDRRAVFIASGDLSHKLTADGPYGFAPQGPVFDEQCTAAFADGNFGVLLGFDEAFCDAAAECGLRSFQIMAGALDGCGVAPELLSYEGPFGVGYGVAAFKVTGTDETRRFAERIEDSEQARIAARREREDAYIRHARDNVERCVRGEREPFVPEGLPAEMLSTRAGAFVSIHEHGRLRGCIGTIGPVRESLALEIAHNAFAACSEDPRFDPITPDELPFLEISVDVLGPTEPISGPDELDVKRYGVIVTCGGRRGLLLPNLDGVDTVAEQIDIARRKGGIGEHEPIQLERFEVVRHEVVD